LVKSRGHVARSVAVHASVTVHDKSRRGSGRLASNSGGGRWNGYSGKFALFRVLDGSAELAPSH